MPSIYPDNFMIRRSETKKAIKGAMLFFAFIAIIVGLFLASDTGQHASFDVALNCAPVNGELQCNLGG